MILRSPSGNSGTGRRAERRWRALGCFLLGTMMPSRAAAGEPEPQLVDQAEELFREGRAALKEQQYDLACEKLAESQWLEPAAGTLLNLAVCLEARGQRTEAWVAYRDALQLSRAAGNAGGVRLAEERLASIAEKLCMLTIVLPEDRPAGMTIELDGAPLRSDQWATPIPLEAGAHVVDLSAPGRGSRSQTVHLEQLGSELVLRLPALVATTDAPAPKMSTPVARREPPAANSTFRAALVVPGAIGVGGLLATLYFGARAASEWGTRDAHCPDHRCDAVAVDASSRAARFARFADVSGAVTVALLLDH